jgi:hypothetical protein
MMGNSLRNAGLYSRSVISDGTAGKFFINKTNQIEFYLLEISTSNLHG